MIVKLIRCQVSLSNRDRFSIGQAKWDALSTVAGFQGQVGGWSKTGEAVVIGFWRDDASYQAFMHDVHDSIFDNNGQKGSYERIAVSHWESIADMPGELPCFPDAIPRGCFVRVALCGVLPDRQEHFQQVQRDIWTPGMGKSPGMLAGVFCRLREESAQYLVLTLWDAEDSHARYVDDTFPELRRQVEFEKDGQSLEGLLVQVDPMWRVEAVRR